MKNLRKLIAAIAATTMVLTSFVQVSALTFSRGAHYKDLFYGASTSKIAAGQYLLSDRSNVGYVVSYGNSSASIKLSGASTSGSYSLLLYGADANATLTIKLKQKSYNNHYKVKFNISRNDTDWRDFAGLNTDSNNAAARFDTGSYWSGHKTAIGTGAENGGLGDQQWYTYEADLNTIYYPELIIAAYGWGKFWIDDIVVTDDQDRLIFSEDFEQNEASSLLITKWYTAGSGNVDFKIMPQLTDVDTYSMTNHVLAVASYDGGVKKLCVDVPIVPNNTYTLSYDKYYSWNYDKAQIVNAVAVGMVDGGYASGFQIGAGEGHVEKTFNSGGNTQLRVAAEGWGEVYLDNIKLEDQNGNTVFFDDFEEHDREISYPIVTINGAQKYTINATGTATVTASVANNNENAPFDCYLIAGVYSSDGSQLEGMYFDSATLSKNTRKDYSFDVPVTNGQQLRLFWWDSLTGSMNPLRKAIEY